MANVLNTLYPPLIDTFMPAFLAEGSASATFSISPYNSNSTITRLHISLVDQTTNLNAFAQTSENFKLIDGIWILSFSQSSPYLEYNSLSELWTLTIPPGLLRTEKKKIQGEENSGNQTGSTLTKSFSTEGYYKLQLRFDESNADITNSYLNAERAHFSEWSSVCLLKGIPTPLIVLTNFDEEFDENGNKITKEPTFNAGLIPIAGKVIFNNNLSEICEETMRSYSISIYETDNIENIVDSIGPVFTSGLANQNGIYWLADGENIQAGINYTVSVTVTTKNQYTMTELYHFNVYDYDQTPFTPTFTFKKYSFANSNPTMPYNEYDVDKIITREDGTVCFNISVAESMPAGYLYVKRASSLDNYKRWELISCTKENGEISIDIEDPTVSSLVRYRYSVQYQTKKGGWTRSYKTSANDIIYPDFYDMLFYRDGRQLALRYDGQITSLRPVVNRQKIDTLGGKYPKFAENAQMNYKQFSISGLIDAESDFNRYFLDDRKYQIEMEDYNNQMNGKYQIRNDTIADGVFSYSNSTDPQVKRAQKNTVHDLYPFNNWWLERKFREEAIQWLNDGEPKLFRSMPEGNMVVMLTDVSLTPHQGTSRMLYNFSATMYEIEDGYSLSTLNSLGIYSITNEKEIESGGGSDSGGEDEDEDSVSRKTIGQFSSYAFPNLEALGASVVQGSMTWDTSETRGLDVSAISIEDFYNFIVYEKQSVDGKLHRIVPNSIKLKDVKINFESKPQLYWFNGAEIILEYPPEGELTNYDENYNDKNLSLGYKIGLIIAGKVKDEDELMSNVIDIFVDERGYYQVPSNLEVSNLLIYDGATATINYKIEYKIQYNDELIPSTIELVDKIVGQLSGVWEAGTYLSDSIKQKHRWFKYNLDGTVAIKENLTNWHAVSLELTPYTTISIRFKNTETGETYDFNNYVIGRTGIYNLVDDYPIDEIVIRGKRMVRVEDSRQDFLDDWEYVLDDSAKIDKSLIANRFNLNWNDFINRQIQERNLLVEINGLTTTMNYEGINRLWNNFNDEQIPSIQGYANKEAIEYPKFNTVYGIKDGENIKLMIYYQDGEWYDISFLDNTQTVALAAVPVHGMINYWADITRQTF